jgi:SAM-dependent methyltransferase
MPTPTQADRDYADRLIRMQRAGWKQRLRVLDPYRWDLRRLKPGFVLEVGCGIGRNLRHLDGHAIGLDLNAAAVAAAREIGLRAFTPEEFRGSEWDKRESYDSLLLSHVAEHMRRAELQALLADHLRYVRPGGKLILITPQEVGFRSDPTHVEFMDFAALRGVSEALGLVPIREYSFPFPRPVGRIFIYNQFVSVSRKQ